MNKNENWYNQKLGKALRAYFEPRGGRVFKHNDFYTTGVPDFSITYLGKTTWLECKVAPNSPTALQQDSLRRAAPHAYVVIYTRDAADTVEIFRCYDEKWLAASGVEDAVNLLIKEITR